MKASEPAAPNAMPARTGGSNGSSQPTATASAITARPLTRRRPEAWPRIRPWSAPAREISRTTSRLRPRLATIADESQIGHHGAVEAEDLGAEAARQHDGGGERQRHGDDAAAEQQAEAAAERAADSGGRAQGRCPDDDREMGGPGREWRE